MNGNQMMGRRTGVPEKSKRGIKGVLKELFTYSSKLRLPMIIAFVFSMIGAVLTIIGPNQLSRITDLISDGLMTGIDLSAVAKVGGVLLAIYLIGEVCGYIEQYIMATVTLDLSKKMRRDLSDKINKVPMKCFGKISHGDILSRVTNDVSTLQQALSNSLPSMISAVAQFVGCLIMMLVTEWRMALAAIAITLIGFVVMAVIMSRSQKYFVARQQSLGKLNGYVEEMYSGHDVVRISRANNEIKKNFAGMNRAVYDANRKSQFLSGVMQPLITAFSYTDDIAQVTTIVGEVAEVLSGEDMQRPESAEKLPDDNAIELKNVRFAYHDKEVLHGVSLHIAPGTVNALVGPSGSGKSTIARLIASLWDVKDGSIELGGVDIRTLPLAECTKRIAYVSQDNYLFDLTVMDNIRMGRKGATDAEVIDAAKKCGCHEFIMGLENGYQTVCGASGGHLSGGERQRISIARAILKDAPVILLDEATASRDVENETAVQAALSGLIKDKTVLIIAHRMRTVMNADQIVLLSGGRAVEMGSPAELLKKNGLFRHMAQLQSESMEWTA